MAYFGVLHHQLRDTTFPDQTVYYVTTPVQDLLSNACYQGVLKSQHANSGQEHNDKNSAVW